MGYRLESGGTAQATRQYSGMIGIADGARAAGQFDTAALAYRRVLVIDPANDRAHRGARHARWRCATMSATVARPARSSSARTTTRRRRSCGSSSGQIRGSSPHRIWPPQSPAARGPTTVAPRLKTRDNRKVTLQFRDAPTKQMVFEVLSR